MHQERDPVTASQLLTHSQDLQNKKNPCQMRENLTVLALEQPTFPVNPLLFRVPGPCLAEILDCRMEYNGYFGKRFERQLAREGPPSALFENSKNLAKSSRGLRPDIAGNTKVPGRKIETGTAEFVNTFTTLPKTKWNPLSYWWNLLSHWYGGLHESSNLGNVSKKSPRHFKVNFRTQILISQRTGSMKLK